LKMKKPGKMICEVLKASLKKPATVKYPYVKFEMPKRFRGKLKFYSERCIGCKACMRDCPSNAIVITKVGDKRFEAEIALDRCLYCAQCVDSCPKDALEATCEYELAKTDRRDLKVMFHAKPAETADADAPEKDSTEDPV
jgi:formate hydrogenlyase subunit 6/NADH:ubiquinone oxidoreductase subunit I